MERLLMKPLFYLGSFAVCSILAFNTGCVSGGFHLTRSYAEWVNSQNIIIRIILYILTSFIFAITMLVDVIVFNTMDFWEGKVSAGDYNFQNGDKTYVVKHEYMGNSKLRRSTIHVKDSNDRPLQEVVLNETPNGEIELYVDGVLRTRVEGIKQVPIASIFDRHGKLIDEKVLLDMPAVATR